MRAFSYCVTFKSTTLISGPHVTTFACWPTFGRGASGLLRIIISACSIVLMQPPDQFRPVGATSFRLPILTQQKRASWTDVALVSSDIAPITMKASGCISTNTSAADRHNRNIRRVCWRRRRARTFFANRRYQDNHKLIAHEYVLMFVRIESALAAAIDADSNLFSYGWDKRVVLAGPPNLLMTTRTVASIWRYELQGAECSGDRALGGRAV
jgi:hypothetical protein